MLLTQPLFKRTLVSLPAADAACKSESFGGFAWALWLGSFSVGGWGCLPQQRHLGDGGPLVWAALLSRKRRRRVSLRVAFVQR